MNITQYSDISNDFPDIPHFVSEAYYYNLTTNASNFTLDLTFGYSDSALNENGIQEDNLALSYYDSIDYRGNIWHSVPVTVDKENNTIKVTTTHLSLWAITSSTETLVTNVVNSKLNLVENFILYENYPNPFNPSTTIRFETNFPSEVRLKIYNSGGKLVRTLINGTIRRGEHNIVWDGRNDRNSPVNSGVYFYRIQTGRHSDTKKMVFIK